MSKFGKKQEPLQAPRRSAPVQSTGSIRKILTIFIGVSFLGLIGFLWTSYMAQKEYKENAVVPVISAEPKPYKVKPENPGGAEIPNQDSALFDALRDKDTDAVVQIQNEKPEEPVDMGKMFAGLKTENVSEGDAPEEDVEVVESLFPDKPEETPEAAPKAEEAVIKEEVQEVAKETKEAVTETVDVVEDTFEQAEETIQKTFDETVEELAKTEQPVEAEATAKVGTKIVSKPEALKNPLSDPNGTHYVQLASVPYDTDPKPEYEKLRKRYEPAIDGIAVRYQEFKSDEKGHFLRIQIGALSKDMATKKCEDIKAKGGGCYLVTK